MPFPTIIDTRPAPQCDCGASTTGKFAGKHAAGCAKLGDIKDVIHLIGALVNRFDNPNTGDEEQAIDAHACGRAAYWGTAKYHNQVALLVREHANRYGLARALQKFADDSHLVSARHTGALIATLVPLNHAAILEISEIADRLTLAPAYVPRVPMFTQAAE